MNKKIKAQKTVWSILLIICILPFVATLCVGTYAGIFGTSDGLCIMCDRIYGIEAFGNVIIFAIYLFWPVYIVAIIVILLAIIRLTILKRKAKTYYKE